MRRVFGIACNPRWCQIGILLCCVLGGALVGMADPVDPLEQLRAIRKQAPSIQWFLSDESLLSQYFKVLQAYFGSERCKRERFDEIRDSLWEILREVPGLGPALWGAKEIGTPIEIKTIVKSFGRELKLEAWQTFRRQWLGRLKERAGPYLEITDENARHRKLGADIVAASQAFGEFFSTEQPRFRKRFWATASEKGWSKGKTQKAYKRAWYDEIQAFKAKMNASIWPALSYLVYTYFSADGIRDQLDASADSALEVMQSFSKHPAQMLSTLEIVEPKVLRSVRSQLVEEQWDGKGQGLFPRLDDLLADESVFPKQMFTARSGKRLPVNPMKPATYGFREVEPFEGIWKGMLVNECTQTMPRRFLTVALEGAEIFYIEKTVELGQTKDKGDLFQNIVGFVHLVPVKKRSTGQTFYSVDFGAQVLGEQGVFVDAKTDQRFKAPFGVVWMHHYHAQFPNKALVIGESSSGDNSGSQRKLRGQPEYWLGQGVGRHEEFDLPGPLGKSIALFSGQGGYSPDMMFDVRLDTAGDIGQFVLLPLTERESVAKKMFDELEPARQTKVLNWLAKDSNNRNVFGSTVFRALENSDSRVRQAAVGCLTSWRSKDPASQRVVWKRLSDPNDDVRLAALGYHLELEVDLGDRNALFVTYLSRDLSLFVRKYGSEGDSIDKKLFAKQIVALGQTHECLVQASIKLLHESEERVVRDGVILLDQMNVVSSDVLKALKQVAKRYKKGRNSVREAAQLAIDRMRSAQGDQRWILKLIGRVHESSDCDVEDDWDIRRATPANAVAALKHMNSTAFEDKPIIRRLVRFVLDDETYQNDRSDVLNLMIAQYRKDGDIKWVLVQAFLRLIGNERLSLSESRSLADVLGEKTLVDHPALHDVVSWVDRIFWAAEKPGISFRSLIQVLFFSHEPEEMDVELRRSLLGILEKVRSDNLEINQKIMNILIRASLRDYDAEVRDLAGEILQRVRNRKIDKNLEFMEKHRRCQ